MNTLPSVYLENTIADTDISQWDFKKLKAELKKGLAVYDGLVYTEENLKEAKKDRATLNKVKTAIETARKEYKKACLKPYEEVESQIKELTEMISQQTNLIEKTLKDYEERKKNDKKAKIKSFYAQKAVTLGDMADSLYESIFNDKWLNASTTEAQYEKEIQLALNECAQDIKQIKQKKSQLEKELLGTYAKTRSLEKVWEKEAELDKVLKQVGAAQKSAAPTPVASVNINTVSTDEGVIWKVKGSKSQLIQVTDFMKAIGVEYEQL